MGICLNDAASAWGVSRQRAAQVVKEADLPSGVRWGVLFFDSRALAELAISQRKGVTARALEDARLKAWADRMEAVGGFRRRLHDPQIEKIFTP